MSKKVNITVEQMKNAVKANGSQPWEVIGVGRKTWFRYLAGLGTTMAELRKVDTKVDTTDTKMTTKEVAIICGVSEKTVYNNANKAGVVLEHGKAKDWTEEELKRLQLVLMNNQISQGTQVSTVKSTVETGFQSGLTIQELIRSGNVDAMKEFMQIVVDATEQQKVLIEAQKQNQLLLEQKEKAEAETERIYQVNKNFHTNLYTASQIASKLGITSNLVGRIANEHGLKQDPIYGKLGKIQLNNGRWVDQFYYNDEALNIMEAVIG